jgi:uncharacterized protein (DUF2141 family)
MKTIAITIVLFLNAFLGFSQNTEGITITVTVEDLKNDNGKVLLALHDASTFMKADGIQSGESTIKEGKVTITFTNVAPGTYAIMGVHDANDNKRMDFQDNGMPKESYGMSNNPMSFGPPQFSEAKFEVTDKDLELDIRF